MKFKKVAAICLTGAIAVTSVSGCSRNTIRKIEGASDDSMKFVNVIEEYQNMKGIEINTTANIDEGVTASIKTILDKNNNASLVFSLNGDLTIADNTVKMDGEIFNISLIDNDVYIDISKFYETLKKLLGEATITTAINELSEELGEKITIEQFLITKIPLGNVDRSAFTRDGIKALQMKMCDIFAVALSTSNSLSVSDNTYTVKISDSLEKDGFWYNLLQGIADNKNELFDLFISYIESTKYADNAITVATTIRDELIKASPEIADMLEAEDINIDDFKQELEEDFNEFKANKDDILAEITMDTVDTDDNALVCSFTVTDTKEGYNVHLDEFADMDEIQDIVLTEYTDTLKAPENVSDKNIVEILSFILAPQYIRYVDKSRQSQDSWLIDSVKSALMVSLSDEEIFNTIKSDSFTVTFDGEKLTCSENNDALIDSLYSILGNLSGFQSKEYQGTTITYTCTFNDNGWYVSSSDEVIDY